MHSKLNHLRSTIPRMIQPLTADYASPEELFNDFSSRAVAASEEVLQFTQLYTANRYLMEHASQSRAASREGIRRWGLKDGMPEGVLIVNEQEREDAKEREERQKQVQKEALERKRRRSAAAGEEMVIDEGPKEGDNGEAELEDEDAKRDEEERKEEGREPREVVEEFKGKLERGEGVEEAWKRVKMEYVHSVGGGVGDLASSGVGGGGQGGELAGGNNTLKLASVVAHIKVTLPPPVNLLFTIAVSPKDTTGGSSSNASGPGYRYTILSLVSATQPDAPITPHLYTGVIRAVAGRPQPGNLRLLLEMLCCYVGVYNERCKKCGRLTFSGGAATVGVGGGGKAELPVVRRRGKVPVPVGAGEKAREKGKPKTELKWEPWHEGCLEERTGTGSGVGN
ncbi:hypothetical protein BDZ91DRAFT_725330 [Kalaharituber pfeilii]|nr:hypothetical protein BDZ91DRAFT_725330 [Kalaharituber pfeilii]